MRLDELRSKVCIPIPVFEGYLEQRGWSWEQLARGDLPFSLKQIQVGIICSDPVLWARAFLREPRKRTDPYEFWEYQLESVRYAGDCIHQDGSEVGKTREIVALLLFDAFTRGDESSMVGAPEQVHLDEIIDACIFQMYVLNPALGKGVQHHRKKPHHVLDFKNGHRIYFCPAGFDGTGFRGKHVTCKVFMDESAKIKHPDIWLEFWRAAEPTATFRIYSVPDGDRTSEYYRLTQAARGLAEQNGDDDLDDDLEDREFKYFHWTKTIQPDPFWSAKRKRHYIKLYHGVDSPGYIRNVLGEHGDLSMVVFPAKQLEKIITDIPEYRVLKIICDTKSYSVFSARYTVVYGDGKSEGIEEVLEDRDIPGDKFDIYEIIKKTFSSVQGLIYVGCDLGFGASPSEFVIRQVIGRTWRTIGRVHLKSVTYDLQADAIDAVDDVFSPQRIGVDFGNAGSAVCHILQKPESYKGKRFSDRVTGFLFGDKYDDMDEDGNIIIQKKDDKPKKKTIKELGIDILISKMQRIEWDLPHDPDYFAYFTSYTYSEGKKHRTFSKGNDHLIDAENVTTMVQVVPDMQRETFVESGVNHR